MNRRGFLRAAIGASVGVVVAAPALVEALSTRSIFLPPRGGWAIATPEEILADVRRCFDKMAYNAGVPAFLENYVDPRMIDYLVRMPGETDAQLRARMLDRSRLRSQFFITETTHHG